MNCKQQCQVYLRFQISNIKLSYEFERAILSQRISSLIVIFLYDLLVYLNVSITLLLFINAIFDFLIRFSFDFVVNKYPLNFKLENQTKIA
jgi:hypothetical protein